MSGGRPKTSMSARSLAEGPASMEHPVSASGAASAASRAEAGAARSRPLDEQRVRAELRRWILEHSKSGATELTDSTPLLESGLLSSLDVVELVLFLEELRGVEIDTDEIEPALFASIDAMWDGFFAPLR